ncbi:MAG: DUF2911 domain-containing protein [Leadbetterella sp.]|nr:DUF2911 domain-containing protein [Leadbetterella sp.]
MKFIKVLAFSLLTLSATAQTLKVPTKSPLQTIKQEFALSSVEIEYSRPSARGRKIFGDLEAYGKLWRTGANSQTTITFGEDVKVNGTPLKAGKYSILTVIGKEDWKIRFCNPATSVFNFKEGDVVATIDAQAVSLPFDIETFYYPVRKADRQFAGSQYHVGENPGAFHYYHRYRREDHGQHR